VPSFQCQVCGAQFDVPRAALDRYPGWRPKYCRDHAPKKTASSQKVAATRQGRGGAGRARPLREENLTPAEARAKYTDGPASGVFTDGSAVPNPGPGGWGAGAASAQAKRRRTTRYGAGRRGNPVEKCRMAVIGEVGGLSLRRARSPP